MTGWQHGATRVLVIATCWLGSGCSRSGTGETVVAPLKQMTAAELRAVPTEAALDIAVQAAVYAWRDFMPVTGEPARAHDLSVSVQVRGGVVPPKVLSCDGVYLVSGDSVFRAPPSDQRAGDGPGAVECILRGGPEWPVGDTVAVIISISGGTQKTMIRRQTTIDATS